MTYLLMILIILMAIYFKDKRAETVFNGRAPKGFPADIAQLARRKLFLVAAASALDELRLPPGNRLEALKGDREGQHSIRINNQWRICFIWTGVDAIDVEIVDYH
jgi:toxin HigB-1